MITSEQDILKLVKMDSWMMNILKTAERLQLPDWWICAGFVRTKVWDSLHGYSIPTELPDIDVIYFDPFDTDKEYEKRLEHQLRKWSPNEPWSVKNQARMHKKNGEEPYVSAIDAVSRFPETATSIALTLNEKGELVISAPWGIQDLVSMHIKPTLSFKEKESLRLIYEKRLAQKDWKKKWPKVVVYSLTEDL